MWTDVFTNCQWNLKEKDRVIWEFWVERFKLGCWLGMTSLRKWYLRWIDDRLWEGPGSGGCGEGRRRGGRAGKVGSLARDGWHGRNYRENSAPQGAELLADHLDFVKACFQIFLGQSVLDLSLVPGHNSWPSVTVFIPKAMPFWVSFRSPKCLASLRWQDLNPKVPFPEPGRCWMKSSGFSSPGSWFCLGHRGHVQVRDQASL